MISAFTLNVIAIFLLQHKKNCVNMDINFYTVGFFLLNYQYSVSTGMQI